MLKAGFARCVITPQTSMRMAGFDRRTQPAEGTLDDLYVSVLALQKDGEEPFLLCSFDLLGCDRRLCEKIRQALSLSPERVWVMATHTHSAPSGAFSGGISQDDDYISRLVNACKATAITAIDNLLPAKAAWGMASVGGVASLRDCPKENAAYDMLLLALKLERAQDSLRLVRYQCHPTVLDERNLCYSRDLVGGIGGAKTLFANGACADLSTRFTRKVSSAEEVLRLGGLVKVALQAQSLDYDAAFGSIIRPICRDVVLPYGNSLRGEARQKLLEDLRQKAAQCTDAAALRELDACMAVLERGDRTLPETRTVTLSVCDLGSRMLLGLPFEVAQEDGRMLEQAVSERCGKPTHLICYCGGYDGYLPHEKQGINYQDLATGYLPQARQMIWNAVLDCAEETGKGVR